MTNSDAQAALGVLAQLRADWPKRGWSWDSRLGCVASSFDAAMLDQAEAAVRRALPTIWSERTMPDAPPALRDIGERSGGVRAGQLIYARPDDTSVVSYGLWWPWGNGSTVSLRVGLIGRRDYSAELCQVFGVDPSG